MMRGRGGNRKKLKLLFFYFLFLEEHVLLVCHSFYFFYCSSTWNPDKTYRNIILSPGKKIWDRWIKKEFFVLRRTFLSLRFVLHRQDRLPSSYAVYPISIWKDINIRRLHNCSKKHRRRTKRPWRLDSMLAQ